MLQIHTVKMTHIVDIFEDALVIDDVAEFKISNKQVINLYSLEEAFSDKVITASEIIKWELQIAKFIFNLNAKGAHAAAIDIKSLVVNDSLDLIGNYIKVTNWNNLRPVETAIISTINKVHRDLFRYISNNIIPEEEKLSVNILYNVATYYYSASIRINSHYSVMSYIRSIEKFYNMVQHGFIDDISNLIVANKYEID